jgi:hypothetical protein
MADDDRKDAPVDPSDPDKPSTAPAEEMTQQEQERKRIQREDTDPPDVEQRDKDSLDE